MVSVEVTPAELADTEAGLREQVGGRVTAGVIAHVRLTVPVNLWIADAVTVAAEDWPGTIEAGVRELTLTLKSLTTRFRVAYVTAAAEEVPATEIS